MARGQRRVDALGDPLEGGRPAGQEPQVLSMYQTLQPMFDSLELGLEQLTLSGRGGWSAECLQEASARCSYDNMAKPIAIF